MLPSRDLDDVEPWSVIAQNLPEHARNPIHTDAGAQAAGFPRALVAGVTTYAYLTHPLLAAWGRSWLERGGAEVRFRRPVFDGDVLRCEPMPLPASERGPRPIGPMMIEARTDEPDQPRAVLLASSVAHRSVMPRAGEILPVKRVELAGEWGSDYGLRAGDPLPLCADLGVVHPAVWPALANHVVHTEVARGSWIHMRSKVWHHGLARAGAIATVRSMVVERFESHGERAVLDVEIEVDGVIVATLEHEAIVALP
jgi:acyl dehydratase